MPRRKLEAESGGVPARSPGAVIRESVDSESYHARATHHKPTVRDIPTLREEDQMEMQSRKLEAALEVYQSLLAQLVSLPIMSVSRPVGAVGRKPKLKQDLPTRQESAHRVEVPMQKLEAEVATRQCLE